MLPLLITQIFVLLLIIRVLGKFCITPNNEEFIRWKM